MRWGASASRSSSALGVVGVSRCGCGGSAGRLSPSIEGGSGLRSGTSLGMLLPLHQALDARDGGHSLRVTALAEAFARLLRWDDLRVMRVRLGARLHDIGKLALSDTLLTKPGPLTDDERDQLREHPLIGAGMIESIPQAAHALPCVLYHHERWDGYGYPAGRSRDGDPASRRGCSRSSTPSTR